MAVLSVSGAWTVAYAQLDMVKARQAAMKSFSADGKAIADYIKGPGDKEAAIKAANDYGVVAAQLSKMWPKGTSAADMPGVSKAKPAVWADGAKFTVYFSAMAADSKRLADKIKTGSPLDVRAASAAFAMDNCVSCHSTYRETQ
ncbi:MAG TPA: cytochrome c [Caulobacteraceae bacterium]|nr:cytochrome c [Caulobacteraceae bacterium]